MTLQTNTPQKLHGNFTPGFQEIVTVWVKNYLLRPNTKEHF
jgi:hypothetical protein